MKTTHTPGPWHCNLGNGTNLTHSPDVWAGSRVVATVGDEWASTYQAEDIANGRLIAAAPDLLAALEYMLRSDDAICNDVGLKSDQAMNRIAAIDSARSAIRKAKGME